MTNLSAIRLYDIRFNLSVDVVPPSEATYYTEIIYGRDTMTPLGTWLGTETDYGYAFTNEPVDFDDLVPEGYNLISGSGQYIGDELRRRLDL